MIHSLSLEAPVLMQRVLFIIFYSADRLIRIFGPSKVAVICHNRNYQWLQSDQSQLKLDDYLVVDIS